MKPLKMQTHNYWRVFERIRGQVEEQAQKQFWDLGWNPVKCPAQDQVKDQVYLYVYSRSKSNETA